MLDVVEIVNIGWVLGISARFFGNDADQGKAAAYCDSKRASGEITSHVDILYSFRTDGACIFHVLHRMHLSSAAQSRTKPSGWTNISGACMKHHSRRNR